MYNTYIFDLDGTLLSTLADLAASCNYALTSNGMPERTIDEVRRFVGNGVKKLMERAVPGGLDNPAFDKTYADFRQHYMQHNLDTTCPYDGVMELLHELKRRGKKVAVVSNKFYAATQELCRHFFGDELVPVAIGEREDIRKKPAPDTVIEAMKQLGVTAEGAGIPRQGLPSCTRSHHARGTSGADTRMLIKTLLFGGNKTYCWFKDKK